MTLTEFLLARIAENEEQIPDVRAWMVREQAKVHPAQFVVAWMMHPETMRAECEAKRKLVEWAQYDDWTDPDYNGHLNAPGSDRGDVLTWLAAVYADHPDYDEAWRA
jgi:hypothetical protein